MRLSTWTAIACVAAAVLLFAATPTAASEESKEQQFDLMRAVSLAHPYNIEVEHNKRAALELHIVAQRAYETKGPTPSLNFQLQEQMPPSKLWEAVMDPLSLNMSATKLLRRIHTWEIDASGVQLQPGSNMRIQLSTSSVAPVAVSLELVQLGEVGQYQVLIAAILLIAVYILIIFDLMHRTIAALLGSSVTLVVVWMLREKPSLSLVVTWIDEGAIGLLLGMMIIIGIFSTTGFFELAAVQAFKYSGGNIWTLTLTMCMISAVLSAFLDNVTTLLLLAPVTLRLASVVELNPVPLLLAEVISSNVGGTATMIGDPPNIILGNALKDHIDFMGFIINLTPCLVVAMALTLLYFRIYWRHEYNKKVNNDYDISELEEQFCIHDRALFWKCVAVLTLVILGFFLHSVTELEPAWIAMLGAAILLLITTPDELDPFLEKVEWSTLLFFAALFVLIEGLQELGLIRYLGNQTAIFIKEVDPESQLTVAMVLILWVSAIVSAFVDNIPWTATMVPIIVQLYDDPQLSLPIKPLAWSLSLGACLGGNGTLIGASANVVTVGIADQAGYPISFGKFFKVGFPVMLITTTVATGYVILVYSVLGWGLE